MAFEKRSLVRSNSIPYTAPDGTLKTQNKYDYATPDPVATLIAPGYFNDARTTLQVNDAVDASCVMGGVADRVSVIITAVPAAPGNVTAAVNTDASGA